MRVTITDRLGFTSTTRTYLDNGFLKVSGNAARTGTQDYLAGELGLDGDPNRIVKVMRPADEVFNSDSLATYPNADVTDDHPTEMVDAENFKQVSVGHVISACKDGDFVKIEMIVKDAETIRKIESGKVQLSSGYSAVYDDKVPTGVDYEFIQRDIKINHVAAVELGRAGAQVRLFDGAKAVPTDDKPENVTMGKIVLDSGKSVDVSDANAAVLVNDSIERLTKECATKDAELNSVTNALANVKSELEKVKKLSSDAAIKERVSVVASAMSSAKAIAGAEFTCDSMDIGNIQRAAMKIVRPSFDWAEKADMYVQAAFDVAVADAGKMKDKNDEDEDEDEDEKGDKTATDSALELQRVQLAIDAANRGAPEVKDHRSEFNDSLANAWQKGE